MKTLKRSTEIILEELAKRHPDTTEFRKKEILNVASDLGYTGKDWVPLCQAEYRTRIGVYLSLIHI